MKKILHFVRVVSETELKFKSDIRAADNNMKDCRKYEFRGLPEMFF